MSKVKRVLIDGAFKKIRSEDIRVGDMLKIEKEQRVPADLILLYTNDKSGTVFVRTDQLDGETDWKIRESVKFTQEMGQYELALISGNDWVCSIEAPHDRIYDFKGHFVSEKDNTDQSLNLNNTIWANMKLASGEAIGLVAYVGKETKMAQNSSQVRAKFGKTDFELNDLSKMLFVFLGFSSIAFFLVSGRIILTFWYLYLVKIFIIFSDIIPFSTKVNVDFAKLYYSLMITKDEQIKGTVVRNSTIPEELGRIEYLLSDKTGTLTRNEMILKHLRLLKKKYMASNFDKLKIHITQVFKKLKDGEELTEKEMDLKHCVLCLILCNNVSPIIDGEERILQASSPDEVALVNFIETLGLKLLNRKPKWIEIENPLGDIERYEIIENFPFSSERKRMGIVLRKEGEKDMIFYLKGADTVMQQKVNNDNVLFIEEETEELSKDGLRTLVLCYKSLKKEEYNLFQKKFNEAGKEFRNRDLIEKELVDDLESKMHLIAVTGVEDLLQEDVKPVIQNIREAGIRVWMLTGDKLETAMCIAISTGFKTRKQHFYTIQQTLHSEITDLLTMYEPKDKALLVTGSSLEIILKDIRLRDLFFAQAAQTESVILCRCAPKQKALVASYLKDHLNKVVCCIGDGGNDVGMIQSSSIGIGIEGKEGRQAALASDISVVKFKYILKLFLWHGRLSYVRTSLLANFVIHRGLIIVFMECFFMMIFYFVSMKMFNGFLTMGYATIFTNFPIFTLIWDIDIPRHQASNYPQLYHIVQQGNKLKAKNFLIWFWKSVFQASIIMIMAIFIFENSFTEIVTIAFTALIITEYLNIFSVIRTWHRMMTIAVSLSAVMYFSCLFFLKDLFMLSSLSANTFAKIVFITLASWLPLQLGQIIQRLYFPSSIDKVIREARLKEKRLRLGANIKMNEF